MEIKEETKIVKYIEYDGIKFYGDGRGYWLGHINGKRKRLHVYVWEKYKGEIPKGYHIHHLDHDKDNNDIANLQLMTQHEHLQLHAQDESSKAKARLTIKIARKAAEKWHHSKECSEWAKENYKTSLAKVHTEKINRICECCGKEYNTDGSKKTVSRFCSNACKSKWRRDNHLDVILVKCVVCGNELYTTKYKGRKTCSEECRTKLLLKSRNDIEWQK